MNKRYDIIHLPDGFMYGIDKEALSNSKPILGNKIINFIGKETVQFRNIIFTSNPSLGLPLLPDIEEDIKSIAKRVLNPRFFETIQGGEMHCFKAGYKAASAKKYTEEDMKQAYIEGAWDMICADEDTAATPLLELKLEGKAPNGAYNPSWNEFIQSLSPKPIAVEVEMEDWRGDGEDPNIGNKAIHLIILKLTPDNKVQVKQWYF